MKLLWIIIPLIVLIGIVVIPESYAMCRGMIFEEFTIIPDNNMKTLVVFDEFEKTQTLVIQPEFQVNAKEFGMILPVPAQPTITEAHEKIFEELEQFTNPRVSVVTTSSESFALSTQSGSGVTVIDTKEVGDFSTVTLTATNGDALIAWLDENKFSHNEMDQESFDYYIQKGGYYFVAIKVNMKEAKAHGSYSIDGKLRPIEFTFSSKHPTLPFRIMTSNMETMSLTLYTLSDFPYYVPGVIVSYVGNFSDDKFIRMLPESLLGYDPVDKWLIRMNIDFDPQKIEQDLILTKTAYTEPFTSTIIFNEEDTPHKSGILDASSSLTRDVLSFAEMIPPKKQLDMGFELDNVDCKKNYTWMTNMNNQKIACVTEKSSDKFVERGWKLSETRDNEILRLS